MAWGKFIVEARHLGSRQVRTLEVGCMGEVEALTVGHIWFPPDRYGSHDVTPKRQYEEARSGRRD